MLRDIGRFLMVKKFFNPENRILFLVFSDREFYKIRKKCTNFEKTFFHIIHFVFPRIMITFLTENVDMPAVDFEKIERWVEMVAASHEKSVGDLTYIFVDDPKILEVNRQFLNHDYFTDIITFDYSKRRRISGDMFISLDTVATNAEQVGATYGRELLRVIIHGVLHLVGINDKGPGEREIMEANENEALEMWDRISL